MSSSIKFLICSITIVVAIFGMSSLVVAQTSSSTCYTNNTGPGCNNAYCEATVCAIDSSCCDTQWDSSCANQAITSCPGNCLTTQGHGAGCSNTACEATVCGASPSCCNTDWDGACVDQALSSCGFQSYEIPGTDLCVPMVAKNGNVAVVCLGGDLLAPLDVNDNPANTSPVVDAGPNQSIVLPTQLVNLSGMVTDDGNPAPASLTSLWTLTAGNPSNVSIASPNSQSTDVTISVSGVYTFQLTADDGELSASDSVQVTVSDSAAPADLIVNNVGVSDSTPQTGQAFNISAIVRNQGAVASSSSTTLRYRRSTNSTITSADTAIGIDSVSILQAGASGSESISVSIGAAGTYWVGACVDAVAGESPTNNQCSAGVQVTVSASTPADLIVNSVSVNDSTPQTGQAFTISTTVMNQGGAASSSSTTLRYRRSTNSTITSADTAIGIDSVSILQAGASGSENISVSIGAAGTYWVGACVDAVAGESPTNNQCSAGVQVTVSASTPADLIVNSVTVSDSTPQTGQAFTISATVMNQGGAASSSSTTLRYRRSTNSTITSADTAIGIDSVSILQAGASGSENISVSIGAAGTYWVGACVDAVAGESPTNNQCSAGVQVTVSNPVPDLIVTDVAVSNPSPQTGQVFNFKATVRNQGGASSSSVTTLRYYRSIDNDISTKDTAVGTDAVPILSSGNSSAEDINGSAATAGTFWIGACVDPVAGESPITNQCSAGVQVTVTGGSPDLIVNSVSVSDSTPETGQSFTINATVRNVGGSSTPGTTTLRYRRSTNSTITSGDTAIGTDPVGTLSAGANSPESISVSISTAGTYWVGACVDAVTGESPTNNQCSAGVQVTVSDPGPADLFVNTVTVSDSTLTTGQSFTLSATVRNQGAGSSSSTTLRYRRSTNSSITSGDTAIGTDPVGTLSAGANSPESIPVSISTAGTYWVGACVDAVTGESPTNNQCSAGVQVTVSAPAPADLIVNTVTVSDSTLITGQSFTLSATVRNQGASSSSATTLRYRRSTNSTITSGDTQIGTDPVGTLSAGANSPESVSVSISSPGTYWVGACVDAASGESPADNQCSAGVQVTVSCPAGQQNVGGVCLIIMTNAGQCSNTPDPSHDARPLTCSSCHSDGRVCTVPPGYVLP